MPSVYNAKKLSVQDMNLLYEIYKYRVLSTAQIAKIGNLGNWYVYKKISFLRELGYLYSEQITGNYIPNQRRQGSYHRISGKGISLLRKNGYLVSYTADELKVAKHRLPYLLTANDLVIPLKDNRWEFRDSREVKNFMDLNRGDMYQGILTNPNNDKEYTLYVFLRKVQANTLERVKQEIMRNPFENVLVITRGESSFNSIINSFTGVDKNDKLIKGGSVKVLPFRFAQTYLTISNDNKNRHEQFLNELGIEIVADSSNKNLFETNVQFDYVVRHNGELKYFVDLLDNDLMKMHEIKRYRKEEYDRDGKRILALTSDIPAHFGLHKKMLGDIHHIDFLSVDPNWLITFATELTNKKAFGEELKR